MQGVTFFSSLMLTVGLMAWTNALADPCLRESGIVLQVLGSGGPIADDARASSAYLVWIDGHSRVLIDAGGGTFLRFGEAGADFRDLDFIGLSHFHADHSADFPALLKSGNFSNRTKALTVAGPDGRGQFPGLNRFLTSLFDKDGGAFGYLAGYLDGSAGLPALAALEIDNAESGAVTVFEGENDAVQIEAMHVPHGIVPALAFRIRVGDETLVFASDQNGNDEQFVEFAKDAAILVMHMPVPEGVSGAGRSLHAPPSRIGEIANAANVDVLVLSHFMARSLSDLQQNVMHVRSGFGGQVMIAADLACYRMDNQED